jgi:hypothetical protein
LGKVMGIQHRVTDDRFYYQVKWFTSKTCKFVKSSQMPKSKKTCFRKHFHMSGRAKTSESKRTRQVGYLGEIFHWVQLHYQ